jgi:hypothetical protein
MVQFEFMLDPTIKPKEKVLLLVDRIKSNHQEIYSMIQWAITARVSLLTAVMEALEEYTRTNNADEEGVIWQFAIDSLQNTHPGLLRESARVLANLAPSHSKQSGEAIPRLLELTEHSGTVVRWASATALAAIHKADSNAVWKLEPALSSIAAREEKESIRKIYHKAIMQPQTSRSKRK